MYNHNNHLVETEVSISYTAVYCLDKDVVLLRSIFALHGAKSHAVWDYQQSLEVDVVIVGSNAGAVTLLQSGRLSGRVILWLNDLPAPSGKYHTFQCKPPLRAFHLMEELKKIEIFVQRQHTLVQLDTARIALVRWPSSNFLAEGRDFLRMCTMLSVRRMTLDELVLQSASPKETCRKLLIGLYRTGCAELNESGEEQHPSDPAPSEASQKHGLRALVGRIRIALGFSSSQE